MTQNCQKCETSFEVTEEDLDFYEKVSPVFAGKKYLIPPPTMCPECRQQRRLSFRNERKLYKRKCDATKSEIISVYSADKKFPVFSHKNYNLDNWDPMEYGQDFDFSKSFFKQLHILNTRVPKLGLHIIAGLENCDYCNHGLNSKDCYQCSSIFWCESCYYSHISIRCSQDIDGLSNIQNQYCYSCTHCTNCYEILFSSYSLNCKNSTFLKDCMNCEYCFACVGLSHKKYYFFNKELTKEDYKKRVNLIMSSYKEVMSMHQDFLKHVKKFPCKNLRNINIENSRGDLMQHSKNCDECFDTINLENARHCSLCGENAFDLLDCDYTGAGAVSCYENIGASGNNSCFTIYTHSLINSYYCSYCNNCKNCFGCVGLKHKQYCILNKQYSKEEYEELVPKIIKHMTLTPQPPLPGGEGEQGQEWGEFFPSWMSPFGYNETVANEYFPLTREEVLHDRHPERSEGSLGDSSVAVLLQNDGASSENNSKLKQGHWFNWSDYIPPAPEAKKNIPAEKLPDDIKNIPDDILNWAIVCEVSKKPFKIIKQELDFYRRMNIPVPRKHPDIRHEERMKLRNPRKLYSRQCQKCNKDIETTYSPERPEIVYCENCYLQEVY